MTYLVYKDIKAFIITVFDKFRKLGNGLNMLNTDQKKKNPYQTFSGENYNLFSWWSWNFEEKLVIYTLIWVLSFWGAHLECHMFFKSTHKIIPHTVGFNIKKTVILINWLRKWFEHQQKFHDCLCAISSMWNQAKQELSYMIIHKSQTQICTSKSTNYLWHLKWKNTVDRIESQYDVAEEILENLKIHE